jgi:hypothetical protein
MPPNVKALIGLSAWNGDLPLTIAHHDVLSLPDDSEAGLFEGPHRPLVVDAGNPCHDSHHYLDVAHIRAAPLIVESC